MKSAATITPHQKPTITDSKPKEKNLFIKERQGEVRIKLFLLKIHVTRDYFFLY